MNKPKLVCLDGATLFPSDDSRWNAFRDLCEFTVCDRTDLADVVDRLQDADMALTNKVPILSEELIGLPQLKYIGVLATGFNNVDTESARESGITVTNIPAYSTASVAQHAISLLLAITNRVESYALEVSRGRWISCPDFSFRIEDWHELAGKTFGVVGFGHTGSATAAIAAALGMKIAVCTGKPQSKLPEGYVKMNFGDLLRESDVVSLHVPLTPDTRHMICAETLGLMKPSAILINTGRGPLVDAGALACALCDRKIFAAGVDVLDNEPPQPGNPLLAAPRCFITPHVAWASVEARERLLDIAVENVRSFLAGNPQNVVN